MSKFAEVVKALRLADKLTCEQLAKKIGSQKGYVSGIETDAVNPPSVKILRKMQKAFEHRGIKLEDLVELAWADKAPDMIHERVMARIRDNPLFAIKITEPEISVPAREAV